ncbi:alanine dehydrogenase [Enteractinococcus fodinae]|uniref:Alanine dehydrogenase n=1 Tax=Enteractinococcus fodinae TaxID=684663 RepID=A0ABU2AXM0_9MICC|nr:alanine dehydrogenase [Enteractinococcus fodinae]MDR7346102.1 alanine dehydrogenase [Enteractinococcus fodinae]
MLIGVPKEIMNNENRVGLTQGGVHELVKAGHTLLVQAGAGVGSGISDEDYRSVGAEIVDDVAQVWERAEMILKVKEPIGEELARMRQGQILFAYLHLAASAECTKAILDSKVTALAYETVTRGRALPLLAPMSQVAGRLAPVAGAYHLTQAQGGSGVLMGGVPGTRRANVVVIGGGVAGEAAGVIAAGMGASVKVIDLNLERLSELEQVHGSSLDTLASNAMNIAEAVAEADLVIGSVLIPGAAAPKLVTAEMVERMRPGSVLVDIAIDQGGCFENSRPTSHENPTYKVGDKIYYCVSNMPGGVPQTSTAALTNATLPYIQRVASQGWAKALAADEGLAAGLNAYNGQLTHHGVFEAMVESLQLEKNRDFRAVKDILANV